MYVKYIGYAMIGKAGCTGGVDSNFTKKIYASNSKSKSKNYRVKNTRKLYLFRTSMPARDVGCIVIVLKKCLISIPLDDLHSRKTELLVSPCYTYYYRHRSKTLRPVHM